MTEAMCAPRADPQVRDCAHPALFAWSSIGTDARLDALKHAAVAAFRGKGRIPADERKAFLSAGFSEGQLTDLLASTVAPAAAGKV